MKFISALALALTVALAGPSLAQPVDHLRPKPAAPDKHHFGVDADRLQQQADLVRVAMKVEGLLQQWLDLPRKIETALIYCAFAGVMFLGLNVYLVVLVARIEGRGK